MENNMTEQNIDDLIIEFKTDPLNFISKNQSETSILEFKSSFELDTALDLCPLINGADKNIILNQTLSLKIFETLVAFANSYGGLLIMGVAEFRGQIVGKIQKTNCQKQIKQGYPCYKTSDILTQIKLGELIICGINRELDACGINFDSFQRRFRDRFTTSGGKRHILFKPKAYPCDFKPGKQALPIIKIIMSNSIDQYIDDIFPVLINGGNNHIFTLGAVRVKPSPTPIYLTIEENNSQNILYALPIRKTGKTELEKDLNRVQTYISNRFGSSLAKQIAKELCNTSETHISERQRITTELEVKELVAQYVTEWEKNGFPYNMVEEYGKTIKSFVYDVSFWQREKHPSTMAFLFMVSLHFNTGWEKWTKKNKNNKIAIHALFNTFYVNYWRTRFRTIYALQYMNQNLIKSELTKKRHKNISAKTRKILKSNVPEKTVVKILKNISDDDMGDISKKAKSVLTEIATLWKDKDAGLETPL